MPWPVHPNGLLGAQGGDNDTYKIERSLRFNSADSAYLSRTFGTPTDNKKWSISFWMKRGALDGRVIFGAMVAPSLIVNFDTSNRVDVRIAGTQYFLTTPVYRDTSAWYHFNLVFDSANATQANRIILYVNGIQQTASVQTCPVNQTTGFNSASTQSNLGFISGWYGDSRDYFDGYLTEINFIDGQALTPSSFGETDAITGRWKAKAYSGTYGTNGFYLKFADNSGTTSTTLGKDSSGNGNNWTPNNFSVTAGADNDSLLDSPTNSGTSGNYCTLNPLGPKVGLEPTASGYGIAGAKDGNLVAYAQAGGSALWISATQYLNSGKWYWEQTLNDATYAHDGVGIKEADIYQNSTNYYWLQTITGFFVFKNNGDRKTGSTTTSFYGSSLSAGNVVGVAFDADNSKLWFSVNGTWVASGNPSAGTNAAFTSSDGLTTSKSYVPVLACCGNQTAGNNVWACNFGQRPFAYTAPTGFKALCTTNLPTPTIRKPSSYMDIKTYTGTGASNSITGLDFSPDLVWIKNRGTTTNHALYDTTRGTQLQLSSNLADSEATSSTGLTAFGSGGFTVSTSSLVNTSGTQYVAWAWDEAPIAGMDIVSYTGTGVARTIAHNLGVAPKMMIVKNRTSGLDSWAIYHSVLGAGKYLLFTTGAEASSVNIWNNTSPTSSVFSVGITDDTNRNNGSFIAYLFAEVEGFSKFGSYTGNGSADGPFVFTGMRPKWVMVKRTDNLGSWVLSDSQRNSYNGLSYELYPNLSNAEGGPYSPPVLDYISNGFKIRSSTASDSNTNGATYIFAAFAESPFKYSRAR